MSLCLLSWNDLGGHLGLFLARFGPQKRSKNLEKLVPQSVMFFVVFWTSFGTILGSILRPKSIQKQDPKLDQFWNPLPLRKRGPGVAKTGIKREWWHCYSYWNYTLQKKGRDILGNGGSATNFLEYSWNILEKIANSALGILWVHAQGT